MALGEVFFVLAKQNDMSYTYLKGHQRMINVHK